MQGKILKLNVELKKVENKSTKVAFIICKNEYEAVKTLI